MLTRARAAACAALLAVVALPGQADASVSGGAAFECTTTFTTFPTTSGSGVCAGLATVTVAGMDTSGHPYAVSGLGNFVAAFSYDQTCLPLPVPPHIGAANGTATVSGLLLTSVHLNNLFADVGSATLSTNFQWLRVGVTAVIVTSGTRVTLTPSGHTAVSASPIASIADGAGVAAFVPLGVPPTCRTPGRLSAEVAGAVTFPL